jgi:hypothetical protein
MSTAPENELDLDKLFLPAWAQEPASKNIYARFEGESERRDDRRGRRGPREGGRHEGGGERRGPRPPGGPGGRGPERGGDRRGGFGGRPGQGPRGERRGGPPGRGDRRDDRSREPRPAPVPFAEVGLTLIADEKGVDSLARQIKMTGRAYPLFDIAQMILQRPERLNAVFTVKKNAEGKAIQPLFLCALDDTLWLSEDEAIQHVLAKHFATFYQPEKTATEPPKGKYTFVAQCGMSGAILGPPNHHDYQNQLRKLHADRFSRMPFEVYKSRVKIVRDEEVVKKWVEDQSWKTEYICLNMPEPLKLDSMEAVEKHFRETHKDAIIKPVETHTMSGSAARSLRSPELVRLVRSMWDDQKRFPLQIATSLSQQFAARGLQFFKVNKTVTHVSVARPHYLDLEATPVSEGVRRIVDFINAHAKCTRRDLLAALAPAPAPPPIPVRPPEPVPTGSETEAATGPIPEAGAPAESSAAAAPPAPQPNAEQTAVISDLHWLVHQGHVIEFANGILETAKKPAPKPPKPARPPKAEPAAPTQAGAPGDAAAPEGAAGPAPLAEAAAAEPTDTSGTVEMEEAARHIETEPGSAAEPVAGVSTQVVRPGEEAHKEPEPAAEPTPPPAENADAPKVNSPS